MRLFTQPGPYAANPECPLSGRYRVNSRPWTLRSANASWRCRVLDYERSLRLGYRLCRVALDSVQRSRDLGRNLGMGPQGLDQNLPQLDVIRREQDAGMCRLVPLNQLAEQLGDKLKVRGDAGLSHDGEPWIAKLTGLFNVALQPRPLRDKLREYALATL